jgi:hypothetical protein
MGFLQLKGFLDAALIAGVEDDFFVARQSVVGFEGGDGVWVRHLLYGDDDLHKAASSKRREQLRLGARRAPLSIIIAATQFVAKPLVVVGTIEASKKVGFETFEPGDFQLFGEVGRLVLAGIEGGSDPRQRGAPVGCARGLGPAPDSWDRRVAPVGCGHRHLGKLARHVRHVAGDSKCHVVSSRTQAGFEARERPGGRFAIEDKAIWKMLMDLLGLRE